MHYGCVDASKDILGISKYFQTWRQPPIFKQANKQIKKTQNQTNNPENNKREREKICLLKLR